MKGERALEAQKTSEKPRESTRKEDEREKWKFFGGKLHNINKLIWFNSSNFLHFSLEKSSKLQRTSSTRWREEKKQKNAEETASKIPRIGKSEKVEKTAVVDEEKSPPRASKISTGDA